MLADRRGETHHNKDIERTVPYYQEREFSYYLSKFDNEEKQNWA